MKKHGKKRVFSLLLLVSSLLCSGTTAFSQTLAAAGREAVLIRGNYWVSGIAGFGANGFSAIAGEYRLQTAGNGENGAKPEEDFAVYVTKEALYFSGDWQTRPGMGNIPVFQRTGEEGFLAAAVVNDSRGDSWIAVFRFKRGLEGAGISGDIFNRMLQVWTNRLAYFISSARTPGDVSLPAALEF